MTTNDLVWRIFITLVGVGALGLLFYGIHLESRDSMYVKCVGDHGAESCANVFNTVQETDRIIESPTGWEDFCSREPDDCLEIEGEIMPVTLTEELVTELMKVNRYVNGITKGTDDLEQYGTPEYWAYPINNKGDCEDYVIAKKRLLKELGWNPANLLITGVMTKEGAHAVLTVRTTQGDYILDNLTNSIVLWSETNYSFFEIQSQRDPKTWLAISDYTNNEYFNRDSVRIINERIERTSTL